MSNLRLSIILAVAFIFGMTAYGESVLLSYYRFDENAGIAAADSVGSNNGTLQCGPVWGAGHIANALSFDGSDDYVELNNETTQDFSITLWVKTTTSGCAGTYWWEGNGLVDAEIPGGTNDFGLSLVGSKFCFGVGAYNFWHPYHADVAIQSATSITDGQWHHLAATRNGLNGEMKIYVDGVKENEATGATGVLNASPKILIGSLQTKLVNHYFKGSIDDVRIYKSVLDADEVMQLCKPTVTTDGVTNLTASSVRLNANLTFMGTTRTPTVGFEYGISQDDLSFTSSTVTKNSIGQYAVDIDNLEGSQVYFYRAFVQFGSERLYGIVRSFRNAPWIGLGNSSSPYQINNAADLELLHTNSLYYGAYFRVMSDIDMDGIIFDTAVIAPDLGPSTYGFDGARFTGTFDGNNHVIRNIKIDTNGVKCNYLGFIGSLTGLARNIILENFTINSASGQFHTGGIAGQSTNVIDNCSVSGTIKTGADCDYVGGIAGYHYGSRISNCSTDLQIIAGGEDIGGIVGVAYNYIINCNSRGEIKLIGSSSKVGGLIGLHLLSTVRNCYSHIDINVASGTAYRVGGFAGEINNKCNVANCYASGTISGNCQYAGGFAGYQYDDNHIVNCYSTGKVSGVCNLGGFVGYSNDATDTFTGCFWDMQTSTRSNSAGGIGLTTAEMMALSTFFDAGWDFTEDDGNEAVWKFIRENEDYPRLIYQQEYPGDHKGLYGVNYVDLAHIAKWWGHTDCSIENDFCEGLDPSHDGFMCSELIWEVIDNWLVEFE